LSHFVEVSYKDDQDSRSLGTTLLDLANKYYGSPSNRGTSDDRRNLEFLFPHYEQASAFMADIQTYLPQVSVDRVA
jgi:hypothetical protein